jgi:single-strand DNA-binding protein
MNTITIHGRLTADPATKILASDKTVVNFSIAEGDKETTNYFNCQAWEKRGAFISKYFTKGKPIIINGTVRTETWEKDGKKYSKQIINVVHAEFVLKDTTGEVAYIPEIEAMLGDI